MTPCLRAICTKHSMTSSLVCMWWSGPKVVPGHPLTHPRLQNWSVQNYVRKTSDRSVQFPFPPGANTVVKNLRNILPFALYSIYEQTHEVIIIDLLLWCGSVVYITSSRRTERLGSLQGIYERFPIKK